MTREEIIRYARENFVFRHMDWLINTDGLEKFAYEIAIEQEEKEQGLADEVERLQRALDDLLETCELNGMHTDVTYQQCKAVYLSSVTPND